METLDIQHPRLPYDEAKARIRSVGFVRMDGHTATEIEGPGGLDELYDKIFPLKDKGKYAVARDFGDALAEAKRLELSELTGGAVGGGDNSVVLHLLQEMKETNEATVAKMQDTIDSLEERLAEVEKPAEVAPVVAEPGKPVDTAASPAGEAKVDPATGKTVESAKTPDTPPTKTA